MSFLQRYAGAISWFPGHMAKATSELSIRVRDCDVVVEVRDARIPFTSANPLLDALAREKPRLVVFNKADLANEQLQSRIAAATKAAGHESLFTIASKGTNVSKLLAKLDTTLKSALTDRQRSFRSTGAVMLVVGVPNTGKSSIINAIRGATKFTKSKGAKTGAQPGVTRSVSLLQVRDSPPLYLVDSPGVMIPRIDSIESGMKLLVTNAVRDAAAPMSAQADWLHSYFCAVGSDRYVSALGLQQAYPEGDCSALLVDLAHKLRAALPKGGPDVEAAARHFVRAYQDGSMGRYTLDHVPLLSDIQSPRLLADQETGV